MYLSLFLGVCFDFYLGLGGVVQPRGWGGLGEMREEGGVVSFPLWNSMQILFLSLPDHWETEVTLFDPLVLFYFPLFIWG